LADTWEPSDPFDPTSIAGAVIDEPHMHRILDYVSVGVSEGASLRAGGTRARESTRGFYVRPTIFDDVVGSMRIAQEEIFGPVLSVLSFRSTDEAIALANDTKYGLAATVWTKDLESAFRLARRIRAGVVCVNSYAFGWSMVPFGGSKQSGFGRDQSLHAFDKYTQLKTTWIDVGRR
jgi:acyl-CoA reductase-like NAD-dependent aldehyde dehydrogenase